MTQPNLYANVESCTLCTVCNTLLYSVQCTLYNCSAVQYTVIFSKEAVGVITKLCTTRECYAVVYYISEFHFNHNTVENADTSCSPYDNKEEEAKKSAEKPHCPLVVVNIATLGCVPRFDPLNSTFLAVIYNI